MNTLTEIFFSFGTENILTFSLRPDGMPSEAECRVIAGKVRRMCVHYDEMFSVFRNDSEISRINMAAGTEHVHISRECFDLLKEADRLADLTLHFFDPLIRPLSELWDEAFLNGTDYRDLPAGLIAERTALCKRSRFLFSDDGCSVMLPEKGMGIDPGGIAKGYVLDRITELPEGTVVSLGGSIAVFGQSTVPVKHPFRPDARPMAELTLENEKAVTSGTGERFLPEAGRKGSHILDRRTGFPADTDIVSVTLVGKQGAELDAFATASVICGPQTFEEYFRQNGIEYLYVTEEGDVYCSEGLRGRLKLIY